MSNCIIKKQKVGIGFTFLGVLFTGACVLSRLFSGTYFWDFYIPGIAFVFIAVYFLLPSATRYITNPPWTWFMKFVRIVFVGVGILSLFLQPILQNTEAYHAAKLFVLNNDEIESKVREVKGFGLFVLGETSGGKEGHSNFQFVISTQSGNYDVHAYLHLRESTWEVYEYSLE